MALLGLLGLQELPSRPGSGHGGSEVHANGIKTVMITNDYPDTASAIAKELGILEIGDAV